MCKVPIKLQAIICKNHFLWKKYCAWKNDVYKTIVTQPSENRLPVQKVRNFSKYSPNYGSVYFYCLLLLGGNLELHKYWPQVSRYNKKSISSQGHMFFKIFQVRKTIQLFCDRKKKKKKRARKIGCFVIFWISKIIFLWHNEINEMYSSPCFCSNFWITVPHKLFWTWDVS